MRSALSAPAALVLLAMRVAECGHGMGHPTASTGSDPSAAPLAHAHHPHHGAGAPLNENATLDELSEASLPPDRRAKRREGRINDVDELRPRRRRTLLRRVLAALVATIGLAAASAAAVYCWVLRGARGAGSSVHGAAASSLGYGQVQPSPPDTRWRIFSRR